MCTRRGFMSKNHDVQNIACKSYLYAHHHFDIILSDSQIVASWGNWQTWYKGFWCIEDISIVMFYNEKWLNSLVSNTLCTGPINSEKFTNAYHIYLSKYFSEYTYHQYFGNNATNIPALIILHNIKLTNISLGKPIYE